jgi:hypothetical protein
LAFFGILFIWPIPIEVFSFALTVIIFLNTSILLHIKSQTLDILTWIEHILLIVICIWLLLGSARWGIGGKLW